MVVSLSNPANKEAQELAASIQARLRQLPNANTAGIRTLRRRLTKELSDVSGQAILDLASALFNRDIWCRFIAYELIAGHPDAQTLVDIRSLEKFGQGMNSWGAVDMFGIYLAGPAWRNKQITDVAVRRWAQSKDRWWRRAALVATIPINSGKHRGDTDSARTLAICGQLTSDRDDMVVKALSWALRALAKRDEKSVRKFLKDHKQTLAARVVREVNNKLDTGLKNPRRA